MYHSCRHAVIGGVFQSPPWSKIPELRSLVDQTVDHPCHRQLGPYHPRARPCDRKSPHDSEGAAGRLYWIRGHAEGHFPAHRIASGEGAEAPEYSGRSRVVEHGRGANGSRTNRRFADRLWTMSVPRRPCRLSPDSLWSAFRQRKQRSSEQLRDYLNARHDLPDAYGIDRESRHVADDDRRAIILRTPSPAFATAVARMAGIEHQSDVKGEASFAQRLSRKIQ